MKSYYSKAFLLLLPSLLHSLLAIADATRDQRIYIVLLEGEPVAFHGEAQSEEKFEQDSELSKEHAKHLIESHDQLLESTLETGTYSKLYSFHHIINGFAVHTTESQAMKLKMAPRVLKVERDRGAKLMTTYTPHFLGLPTAVWPQEGGGKHAGEGILVGVIDTGINPDHPSFAFDPSKSYKTQYPCACDIGFRFPIGSCNGKIASARSFYAGAAAVLPLNTSENLSPFDEVGHGSHVASVVAGNWGTPVVVDGVLYGIASGMAPGARLAIYKAVYPQGGTLADVVAAIEQAAKDRVDVLVLSVGPDEPPEDTITMLSIFDVFLLFARRAGLYVAQAAGNRGPADATVVSFSPWAVGVAASTTDRSFTTTLFLGHDHQLHGVGLSAPTSGNGRIQFKLVDAKDASTVNSNKTTVAAEECQNPEALQPETVKGSIVICTFSRGFLNGTSSVAAILNTSKLLGFSGFILAANPNYGDFIAEPLPFTIPGVMLPRVADVNVLFQYYEKNTHRNPNGTVLVSHATAVIGEGRVAKFGERAPVVARFSSRGPDVLDGDLDPADVLKPDILAPGHQIWAAWSPASVLDPILTGNNFALLSGTSMATPHVAGVAALIKKSRPSWTPSMISSAMSTTSSKHDNRGESIASQGSELYRLYPSTPFDYGAGFVDPFAALDPGLVFSSAFEDYISFLCSLPNIDPAAVRSATGITCNTTLPSPADLNLPSITISALREPPKAVRRIVASVGKHEETYICSILSPEGVQVTVKPSWFAIAPEGTQELVIEFNVTRSLGYFTFGEVVLVGSFNHIVRLPLAIRTIK